MYLKVVLESQAEDKPTAADVYVWGKINRIHYQVRELPGTIDEVMAIAGFVILSDNAQAIIKNGRAPKGAPVGILIILKSEREGREQSIFTDGKTFLLNDEGQTIERLF